MHFCVGLFLSFGVVETESSFNVDDYSEIDRLLTIVNDPNDYENRLEAVSEARQLILNKYNLWPTIKSAIDSL